MMRSVNRTKRAKRALENIYCFVWYVSIGSELGCARIWSAYLLYLCVTYIIVVVVVVVVVVVHTRICQPYRPSGGRSCGAAG